jgi:hypothetical protein
MGLACSSASIARRGRQRDDHKHPLGHVGRLGRHGAGPEHDLPQRRRVLPRTGRHPTSRVLSGPVPAAGHDWVQTNGCTRAEASRWPTRAMGRLQHVGQQLDLRLARRPLVLTSLRNAGTVRLAGSVRQGPGRHGFGDEKPPASKDASASRWLFRWIVAVRVSQAGRGLAAQRPRSVPRLMLCSSSIRRRRVRSDWRSSSRSSAASMRAWSPSEATWGRTPWPSGSRLAARRRSS